MPARIEFTDEQLDEMCMMYRHGYSSREIAEWFGVSKKTVLDRLRENGCEIRPARPRKGTKPWNYVERDVPDPWTDTEAAYTFGVLIGDASILQCKSSNGNYTPTGIYIDTPDEKFAATISEAIELAFGINVREDPESACGDGTRYAYCSVDLGRSYDSFKWRTETWRVPEEFLDASEEVKTALCQGKLDSDGWVEEKTIIVESICKRGLKDLQRIVEKLHYRSKLYGPYKDKRKGYQDSYRLRIPGASPELFRLSRKRKLL